VHLKGTECLRSGVEFPVAILRRGPTGSLCTEPELKFVDSLELSFVEDYCAGAPLTAREGPSPPREGLGEGFWVAFVDL
jgi:hypothetical protein